MNLDFPRLYLVFLLAPLLGTFAPAQAQSGPQLTTLRIVKRAGSPTIPGTYAFTVACNGANGPSTYSVAVVLPLPGSPAVINVPVGDTCTVTETPPTPVGAWNLPTWGGATVIPGSPWAAQVGPITAAGVTVGVDNWPVLTMVPFTLQKGTSPTLIPGTFAFTVHCLGGGGGITSYPVTLTLPGSSSSIINVPVGSTCSITEIQPAPAGTWNPPIFTGSGVAVTPGSPWAAQVGPITTAGGTVLVSNSKTILIPFTLQKSTGTNSIPGTYSFTVACSVAGGSTSYPVTLTLPGSPSSIVNVPAGSTCNITETQPPPAGTWNPPTFTGSGVTVTPGPPWTAQVGPITTPGGTVLVGNSKTAPVLVPFTLHKSTGTSVIAGTYAFTVVCNGAGGSSTYSVAVTLPGGSNTVNVPSGDVCLITETAPPPAASWNPPTFTGSGFPVETAGPWQVKIGPVATAGSVLVVTNSKKPIEVVSFNLRKSTGAVPIAGTYAFTVACSGQGGPYTGGPVSVTLPAPGFSPVSVPAGSTCTITETPPTPAFSWDPPTFTGNGITVMPGQSWSAQVGPVVSAGGTVLVTNKRNQKK